MLSSVIEIARKAGEEILRVYGESFGVSYKEDSSPLTDADRNSNEVITGELSRLFADIPIISEEEALAPVLEAAYKRARPQNDMVGPSPHYRKTMVRVLVRRGIQAALEAARR